ncbi:MAG: adenine deaminase [Rikenellaceae bacterium]
MRVEGKIVDIYNQEIYEGSVEFHDGVITNIERHSTDVQSYIMLGFIDAHVHIESSMLRPTLFGDLVAAQGTVGVVTDPHEIANVLGVEGVEFMMDDAKGAPIKIYFTIPSSVPATPFDVAGGVITSADVEQLARSGRFVALSEVMNVPGVLFRDEEVMAKLAVAKRYGLPIDGHSPLLYGDELTQYIESGISTDHESLIFEGALEKIEKGMKILIREGSAAKNYESLSELIATYPDSLMFCTDDSHPDDIIEIGHINKIVRRAIKDGYPLFDVLKIACVNPILHYKLGIGTLRVGESADFIVVEELTQFKLERLYIDGELRYNAANQPEKSPQKSIAINNFHHDPISPKELELALRGEANVIELIKNELITKLSHYTHGSSTTNFESDPDSDIAKIVYINRYTNGTPQVALCRGFGLKRGAIASSIGHDSHNIVAVGCSDGEICDAVNLIIANRGGLSLCDGDTKEILPLPIGGIMSDRMGAEVAAEYGRLQAMIKGLGSTLDAPYMTLSFLSLVVIPDVKIGEKGLFSYTDFDWID